MVISYYSLMAMRKMQTGRAASIPQMIRVGISMAVLSLFLLLEL